MRISDWSSDVCSSDLSLVRRHHTVLAAISSCYSVPEGRFPRVTHPCATKPEGFVRLACVRHAASVRSEPGSNSQVNVQSPRSEEHTSELQSLMRISYAVFCLKKKPHTNNKPKYTSTHNNN